MEQTGIAWKHVLYPHVCFSIRFWKFMLVTLVIWKKTDVKTELFLLLFVNKICLLLQFKLVEQPIRLKKQGFPVKIKRGRSFLKNWNVKLER